MHYVELFDSKVKLIINNNKIIIKLINQAYTILKLEFLLIFILFK